MSAACPLARFQSRDFLSAAHNEPDHGSPYPSCPCCSLQHPHPRTHTGLAASLQCSVHRKLLFSSCHTSADPFPIAPCVPTASASLHCWQRLTWQKATLGAVQLLPALDTAKQLIHQLATGKKPTTDTYRSPPRSSSGSQVEITYPWLAALP